MKISVIMSVCDNEGTVSEAISSVLNQTFKDFEFIIVDDGSTDGSGKIIKEFQEKDSRIHIITQKNKGLTKSLNKALEIANGEYIARQDADDISLPDRFFQQACFLDKNKDIGFVGCACEIIDADGDFINFTHIKNNPKQNISALGNNNIFCHGSIMFRREPLVKARGYREFFKYAQDYDLYLRLIEITLPGSVNKILYKRRVSSENISVQRLGLQYAYTRLAKQCHERRSLKQEDSILLKEDFLDTTNRLGFDEGYVFNFMKALYFIKHSQISQARCLIRPYLFPLNLRKFKLYLFWFFSYLPLFVRNAIFKIKTRFRKSLSLKLYG